MRIIAPRGQATWWRRRVEESRSGCDHGSTRAIAWRPFLTAANAKAADDDRSGASVQAFVHPIPKYPTYQRVSVFISGSISGLLSSFRIPIFDPHLSTDCPRIDSLAFGYGLNAIPFNEDSGVGILPANFATCSASVADREAHYDMLEAYPTFIERYWVKRG
jgi:hypothetical protein